MGTRVVLLFNPFLSGELSTLIYSTTFWSSQLKYEGFYEETQGSFLTHPSLLLLISNQPLNLRKTTASTSPAAIKCSHPLFFILYRTHPYWSHHQSGPIFSLCLLSFDLFDQFSISKSHESCCSTESCSKLSAPLQINPNSLAWQMRSGLHSFL